MLITKLLSISTLDKSNVNKVELCQDEQVLIIGRPHCNHSYIPFGPTPHPPTTLYYIFLLQSVILSVWCILLNTFVNLHFDWDS